jgi:hypothetical protein
METVMDENDVKENIMDKIVSFLLSLSLISLVSLVSLISLVSLVSDLTCIGKV